MNYTRHFLLCGAVLAMLLAFSGCNAFETDTEALLEPPSLTEEQEKLNAALSEVAGTDYRLKYPTSGDSSSAFMFVDLDSDGIEEALAFYSIDEESTRINVLKEDEGNWVSVYEAAGLEGNIENVRIADTAESHTTLIVRWEQAVGVYRFIGGKLERLHSSNCDGVDIADMNGDGFDDIILFSGSYVGRSVARILYEADGELNLSAGADLTAQYSDIVSAVSGELYSGHRAYFIDAQIYNGIYITEVLTLEENSVVCQSVADLLGESEEPPEESDEENTVTVVSGRGNYARSTAVFCHDINGDGTIEFPIESRDDYAFEGDGEIYFIRFFNYNGTSSVPINFCIADEENGFVFDLPALWEGRVTVSYSEEYGEYRINSAADGADILCVRISLLNDYMDIFEEAYVLSAQTETRAFFVRNYAAENSEFYLDPNSFGERFHLI